MCNVDLKNMSLTAKLQQLMPIFMFMLRQLKTLKGSSDFKYIFFLLCNNFTLLPASEQNVTGEHKLLLHKQ